MSKASAQPAENHPDALGLSQESFEISDKWYRLQRRNDRPAWFIRFPGLNGRGVTYSTGQMNLELAKAQAAGFIEGYNRGVVEGGSQ